MGLFDTGVRPAIDAWLLAESQKVRSYGDYWSASSAGYCMRKVIFERLGVPHVKKEDDARKQRVFSSGHLFHSWIQGITKEAGISIAQELELIDDELMIKGHFDDLVLIGEGPVTGDVDEFREANPDRYVSNQGFWAKQSLILYDYKTQNSRAFNYKRPNMSHFHKMQLGTYMYMLRKKDGGSVVQEHEEGGFNVHSTKYLTEARILKMEKDTLRMAEEQLMWSPELEKEIVGYWTTLNGYWKKKTIPTCTCAKYEGGFMAREQFNPYYYEGEPCSIALYNKWRGEQSEDTTKSGTDPTGVASV